MVREQFYWIEITRENRDGSSNPSSPPHSISLSLSVQFLHPVYARSKRLRRTQNDYVYGWSGHCRTRRRERLTFFEALDDVADERRAVDRHAQQGIGHDARAQRRAEAGHAAARAARAVVPAAGAALDQLVQLCAAERRQAPDVRHVRVERAQRHAHLPQLDVDATVGQVVRRRGQLPVVDDLRTTRRLVQCALLAPSHAGFSPETRPVKAGRTKQP